MKKISLLFSLLTATMACSLISANKAASVKAEDKGNGLVYSLDFEDSTNLGKNSAGTLADATVHSTENHVRQIVRKGDNHGVFLDGGTHFENYLDLPTTMFEGVDNCTIAGWFYHPTGADAYQGEIGIYSQDNNKSIRTDQYASYHKNCYLYVFGNDQCFESTVFPVYDAWYHMAYTFNNGTVTVHQNGKLLRTFQCNSMTSVSVLHSATSHFYLGQSAYENDHTDYYGGFDDIRVYNKALSNDEIVSEYGLKNTDFLVNEYTFDTSETMLKDNIRNHTLSTHDADTTGAGTHNDPVFDNGAMYLDDSTVIVSKQSGSFGDPINPNLLFGMNEVTFDLDLKVDESSNFDWVRIFDIFTDVSQKFTWMSHTGGASSSMNIVIDGGQWVINEQTAYTLNVNRWYNLGVVMTVDAIRMYVNGVKICDVTLENDLMAYIWNFVSSNNSWFTLGAPVYEGNRYISAWYDNFRIYATSLNDSEMDELAKTSRIYRTITIGETTVKTIDGEPYQLEQMTRDGYSFIGYEDKDGNIYVDELPANTGDIVLTPKFEELEGSITFVASGAEGSMEPIDVTSSEITLPACGFVKLGYDFLGWATQENGDVVYEDGATLVDVKEDIVLYAVFSARTYTITFDANGGTGTMETMSHTVGENVSLTKNIFTREGYTFSGWALTETGLAEFDDEQSVTIIGAGYDVTLYAVWTLNTITITFDANGGTGTMENITIDALEFVKLPKCAFVKEGYEFKGWALTSKGEVEYKDEDLVEFANNVTLFAIYEKKAEEPVDPSNNGDKKKGCHGSIAATSLIISSITLAGSLLLFRRNKEL